MIFFIHPINMFMSVILACLSQLFSGWMTFFCGDVTHHPSCHHMLSLCSVIKNYIQNRPPKSGYACNRQIYTCTNISEVKPEKRAHKYLTRYKGEGYFITCSEFCYVKDEMCHYGYNNRRFFIEIHKVIFNKSGIR